MRPKPLLLEGVTKQNRHAVTIAIRDAISAAGGWISSENLFSNLATSIHCFMPPAGLAILKEAISSNDVMLDDNSHERLLAGIAKEHPDIDEMPVSLNITFSHNEPDLKREIPAVPG